MQRTSTSGEVSKTVLAASVGASPPCEQPGWFPDEFGLKDHTVFWYDGYYYLASIYLSPEDRFAYGRSTDLCSWEDLSPVLSQRVPGTWDEQAIWAPFVYEEEGVYYMYYTGVTSEFTQSIMLATSTDPADPHSWQPQGMIFQPEHPGMVWPGRGKWSDCRDPTVRRWGALYYLYYTGLDEDGGIVGLATATSPEGPWRDWGAVLTVPGAMLESSTVIFHEGWYYLIYNRTDNTGPEVRFGPTPAGPWSAPRPFCPGWAHEVWQTPEGDEMTSYLTTYQISIRPLTWDTVFYPPWPFIGERVFHLWIPVIRRAGATNGQWYLFTGSCAPGGTR